MINTFPKIMGILNVTPDSFSDGGKFRRFEDAVTQALRMLDEGADLIDIGGESTRPGALPVEAKEEIERIIPVIKSVKTLRPDAIISVDTVKYEVAEAALNTGAGIINDISGLDFDSNKADLAAARNVPLILMHIQGVPRNMQHNPVYDDVVLEVFDSLKEKIQLARNKGVNEVIADVGIGFGKTLEHNISLLKNLAKFHELKVPLLLGISRKSFIGKLLGIETPEDRDTATAILHSILLRSKIDIIRVHNVRLIYQLKILFETFN